MPEPHVLGCVPKIFKLENAKEKGQRRVRIVRPCLFLENLYIWKTRTYSVRYNISRRAFDK